MQDHESHNTVNTRLPIVTPEIVEAASQSWNERGDSYLADVAQRLADTQQTLGFTINTFTEEAATPEERSLAWTTSLRVYDLLDKAAAANEMEGKFSENPESSPTTLGAATIDEPEHEPRTHLPIVTPELMAGASSSVDDEDEDYLDTIGRRLADTQPALKDVIDSHAQRATTPEGQSLVAETSYVMYDLLEKAADAEAMNRMFGSASESGPAAPES